MDLGSVEWLPVPAAAWLCELIRKDLDRPLLIVVPHESDALSWVEAVELVGGSAGHFSAPSLTPYQAVDVSLQVRAAESVVLHRILSGLAPTVVCTPRALFRRLPRPEDFRQLVVDIRVGEDHPLEDLADRLTMVGYHRTDLVTEPGEFATRGGIFDLYSPGQSVPVRLDLFGDTVESIRQFNPEDQRSLSTRDAVSVLPLSLYPAGETHADALRGYLTELEGPELGVAGAEQLESLSRSGRFPGWENYLPLLAEGTVSLGSWVDRPLIVSLSPSVIEEEVARHTSQMIVDHKESRERGQIAVSPESLELPTIRGRCGCSCR